MRRSSSLAEAWGSFGREYLLYNLLRASPRVITGKGVSEPRQSARRRCPVQGNPWLTDQRTRVTRRICGARPSLRWIVMDNDTSLEWIVMPHRQLQSPCVLSLPQDFLTQRRCSCTECENPWPINGLACYSSHGFPS